MCDFSLDKRVVARGSHAWENKKPLKQKKRPFGKALILWPMARPSRPRNIPTATWSASDDSDERCHPTQPPQPNHRPSLETTTSLNHSFHCFLAIPTFSHPLPTTPLPLIVHVLPLFSSVDRFFRCTHTNYHQPTTPSFIHYYGSFSTRFRYQRPQQPC